MSPLTRGEWRGALADVLENDELRVVVLPEHGARLASVYARRSGREWLQAPRADVLGPPAPSGSVYTDTDHFGWDEMFPTVDQCVVAAPGGGMQVLPDHGEFWNRTWERLDAPGEQGEGGDVLTHAIDSTLFPCRLVRRLSLVGRALRLEYALSSCALSPFRYLWAAHPQFVCAGGTTLAIEPTPARLIDVTACDTVAEVPITGPLSVEDDLAPGTDAMLYVPPENSARAARLDAADGAWLRVSWHPDALAYLGIWLDRGYRTTGSVGAVEPTTAYYDSLARAERLGRAAVLEPGETRRWWLTCEVGERGDSCTNA